MHRREHRAMRSAERERLVERGARRFREIDRRDNTRELIHVVLPTGTACRSTLPYSYRRQERNQRGGWTVRRNRLRLRGLRLGGRLWQYPKLNDDFIVKFIGQIESALLAPWC